MVTVYITIKYLATVHGIQIYDEKTDRVLKTFKNNN